MPPGANRLVWGLTLVAIIAAGIGSRNLDTGLVILDKYLGDALYAAMIYAILRFFTNPPRAVPAAALVMLAIECFQLTMIPARLAASNSLFLRFTGWLLGTQFSWSDLLAYAAGIGAIYLTDSSLTARPTVS